MGDYNNGTLPDPCLRLDYGFGEQWASVELGDGTGYVRLADYESVQAENAKLRELVRGLHIAHVGMTNRYKGSEIALICEYSGDIENDARKLESECAEECHRFDAAMRELGIEADS